MKQLFAEYPEEQREQYLRDNCYEVVDNETFTRPLTDEEIEGAKNELVKTSIEIREKEDDFKEVKKAHNTEMKKLKQIQGDCIREVEFGKATEKGEVFLFDDQDIGMMESYDRYGRFISARPLLPAEKQTSIFTIKKAE